MTVLGRRSRSTPHMMPHHLTWTRKRMISSRMIIKSRRRKMAKMFPALVKWPKNRTEIIASKKTLATWRWSQIWEKSKPSQPLQKFTHGRSQIKGSPTRRKLKAMLMTVKIHQLKTKLPSRNLPSLLRKMTETFELYNRMSSTSLKICTRVEKTTEILSKRS